MNKYPGSVAIESNAEKDEICVSHGLETTVEPLDPHDIRFNNLCGIFVDDANPSFIRAFLKNYYRPLYNLTSAVIRHLGGQFKVN